MKKWWNKLKSTLGPGGALSLREACPSPRAAIHSGEQFGQAPRCSFPLASLRTDNVRSSCTGPDTGVRLCLSDLHGVTFDDATDWAFGCATSLYDAAQPGSEARAGDPIADCFAIISYDTHTLLAVADGVNWGEPAKRAARSAVSGSVAHLHKHLSGLGADGQPPLETSHVFQHMISALDPAQKLILSQFGTLTTLVLTVVARLAAPLKKSSLKPTKAPSPSSSPCYQWVALTLTVGDSSAFVYRQEENCVEELTHAASAGAYRDPRWTPGALGYAAGEEPDLSNMTCTLTLLSEGDLVFLTSDGVADNFDPFMLKMARQAIVAPEMGFNDGSWSDEDEDPSVGKQRPPVMDSEQSHAKKMELLTAVVQAQRRRLQGQGQSGAAAAGASASTPGPSRCGGVTTLRARALVEGLLQHVTEVTEDQRRWSERRHKAKEDSRRKSLSRELLPSLGTDTRSSNKDTMPPGKMDHATVAAYLVGARD